ncbi:MAG: hypothetical protein ABIC04_01550 [Nanoarchaeota archaeon]
MDYKQFPLWNPFVSGGVSNIAHPLWSKILSLSGTLVLFYGEIIGLKISIFVHLSISMFGMYLLSKYYGINNPTSLLPPIIFMLSGFYVSHLVTGHTWVLMIAFIPYVFLFYLKSYKNNKNIFFASISLSFMLLGGTHIFLFTSLFLLIYSVFKLVESKKTATMKILLTIFTVTVLLSSIKLIPNIDFLSKHPRFTGHDYSGYSLNTLYLGLLDKDQRYFTERDSGQFYNGIVGQKGDRPFITGISHGWEENGAYMGLIPLALFLIGIFLLWKKHWPLILTSFIFLWLSFGHRAPISLWKLFKLFPIWNMVSSASRSILIFIFCLAIIDGLTLQKLCQLYNKKSKHKQAIKIIISLIVFFVAFDLIFVNGQVLKDAFIIPPLNITPNKEFSQTQKHYVYSNLTSMYDYPNYLRNEGKVNAYIEIPIQAYAIPKESENYKGELYLQNTKGEASYSYWSPNKLIVDVNVSREGYLVINQNYDKGWKTKNNRKVESFKGLISTKVYRRDKQITFYYLPNSFILGSFITIFTIAFVTFFLTKPINAKKRQ